MPNLYGIANPNPLPVIVATLGSADVNITTAETTFATMTLNPPTVQGVYFPVVMAEVWFSLTATPPTSINWAFKIGAGSDIATLSTYQGALVANANLFQALYMYGFSLLVQNPAPPTVINVTAIAGTNPFAVRFVGTFAYGWWQRGPD